MKKYKIDSNYPKFVTIQKTDNIEEIAKDRINVCCQYKNYEFISFYNKNREQSAWLGCGKTMLKLHCNICNNEWLVTYDNFVNHGYGCNKCAIKERTINKEQIINEINDICYKHNLLFKGFVNNEYVNNNTKIILQCKKCGFEWNTTSIRNLKSNHISCTKCNPSVLENIIIEKFKEIEFKEYEFNKHYDFLNNLQLDFYIPSKNIAIECQGIQHFKPTRIGGITIEKSIEKFILQEKRDINKKELCEKNGIKLLYFSNLNIEYPYFVYTDIEQLMQEVLK